MCCFTSNKAIASSRMTLITFETTQTSFFIRLDNKTDRLTYYYYRILQCSAFTSKQNFAFFQFTLKICHQLQLHFYSPSCLSQEPAKGPFGFRVSCPPAQLSTTHSGGFVGLTRLEIKPRSTVYFLIYEMLDRLDPFMDIL